MKSIAIVTLSAAALSACVSVPAPESNPPVVLYQQSPPVVVQRSDANSPIVVHRADDPVVVYRQETYTDPIVQYRMQKRRSQPDSRDYWLYVQ